MKAVRWKGAWQYSIFLAFLSMHVRHSNALNYSIDVPYTPYRSSDGKYDFVDVAQQQSEISKQQSETGQTSRFYTSADVDEKFWLKELGDDYKNAIHMQVSGDERHNGVFNMSENGSAYKVQPIENLNTIVNNNEIKISAGNQGKNRKRNKIENNEGKKRQKKLKHEKISEKVEQSIKIKSNATKHANKTEAHIEENITETTALDKKLKENVHEDLSKYTKFQHIHMQYAPELKGKDDQENQALTNQTLTDQTIEQSSVVVNLPETSNVVEVEANDAPVVVNMPPVIYHSKPANLTDQDSNDNTAETEEQSQKLNTATQTTETVEQQKATADVQKESDIDDNTQYKQQIYTPLTYEQQQYCQQQTQYPTTQNKQQYSLPLEYTNFQQQQQHTQYPVQIQQTEYQEQQSIPYTQHVQQQYSPVTLHNNNRVSSTYHHNRGVYPLSDISSEPAYPSLPNILEPSNRNAKVRYMLSKPSILNAPAAAYGAYGEAPQVQTEYNRERRSTRQLYQEGL
ncbi:SUN domain-containing protein 2 [Eurosta solidaginis]|uniref:SUN domain-containing protein 2 n=1 Tax=Eurosta solidaginis TaxID=178769 RepID=UPI0035317D51